MTLTGAHVCLSDRWGLGHDESPVKVRQPPKALSVQMSITPLPLQRHPDAVGTAALAGESAGPHRSQPVPTSSVFILAHGVSVAVAVTIIAN